MNVSKFPQLRNLIVNDTQLNKLTLKGNEQTLNVTAKSGIKNVIAEGNNYIKLMADADNVTSKNGAIELDGTYGDVLVENATQNYVPYRATTVTGTVTMRNCTIGAPKIEGGLPSSPSIFDALTKVNNLVVEDCQIEMICYQDILHVTFINSIISSFSGVEINSGTRTTTYIIRNSYVGGKYIDYFSGTVKEYNEMYCNF